ncbi:hypothetical protein [Streptomyces sp. NBC_01618]|uniref:hypothetical protein n=1 Tax=Streptomyces sp. NBC_01618 TaxID=2975900 RepID=UPI0038655B98|nr:hypothetical protein OH735_34135 [Streptomyces sp. NBC_01618]
MKLYVAVPVVLLALLIAASGVAGITRGWVLPTNRRPVHRPRLYGWGQLVGAFALCWQQVFFWVLSDPDIRQWGTLAGSVLLLTGLIMMMVSRRAGGSRQGSGTP